MLFIRLKEEYLTRDTKDLVKQLLIILSALGGAQTGALIINWLTQEHISS